ncbi:maleylpyruvate isomerase N-terminal domain-containing protein [Spirillospora sp. NPDC029432]|uniref:maleylpyruvate isomerase N-terminal domain-containing protein n=1 Tax=Spirillospora sp. NPDC029432 TaxID=3154599 RepID=UPI003456AAC5
MPLADDLDRAVRLALDTLRPAAPDAWDRKAGSLDWTCWETAEHLADDLFSYAAQLGPRTPAQDGPVPFAWVSRRPGGPRNAIHADRAAGPDGLLQVLEASGAMLSALVRAAPPELRSYHSFGVADPAGFAAMGVVETLVHTHDMAEGLGLGWTPPAGVCAPSLARLFPDVPGDGDPWTALLWATGRAELPGRPRRTGWSWRSAP